MHHPTGLSKTTRLLNTCKAGMCGQEHCRTFWIRWVINLKYFTLIWDYLYIYFEGLSNLLSKKTSEFTLGCLFDLVRSVFRFPAEPITPFFIFPNNQDGRSVENGRIRTAEHTNKQDNDEMTDACSTKERQCQ